jgi:hypothetical protein
MMGRSNQAFSFGCVFVFGSRTVEYDDVIIGSGLSAIATAVGLPASRKVLVIAGPRPQSLTFYDAVGACPNAAQGFGGLGEYWHGVIPTGLHGLTCCSKDDLAQLFSYFYPDTDIMQRLGHPGYFVPWKPIRPSREWPRLQAQRNGNIIIASEVAVRLGFNDRTATVETATGQYRGLRLWLCSGALHTPRLIDASFKQKLSRSSVSDHFICYFGQRRMPATSNTARLEPRYTRDGFFLGADYALDGSALCISRPAHFGARVLDKGVHKRFVFGLPTQSIVKRLLWLNSAGLLAEAIFNKTGLFAESDLHNVYAQVDVPDAYDIGKAPCDLLPRTALIRDTIGRSRAAHPFGGELLPTQRPDCYLPGIHLYGSLDGDKLAKVGVNTAGSPIQIADASLLTGIGPDHHSFRMMAASYAKARAT